MRGLLPIVFTQLWRSGGVSGWTQTCSSRYPIHTFHLSNSMVTTRIQSRPKGLHASPAPMTPEKKQPKKKAKSPAKRKSPKKSPAKNPSKKPQVVLSSQEISHASPAPMTPEKKQPKKKAKSPAKRKSPKKSPAKTPTKKPQVVLTSQEISQVSPDSNYEDLEVSPEELRPSSTLTTGQCFHWTVVEQDGAQSPGTSAWGTHDNTEWVGVIRLPSINKSAVVSIRETTETTLYRVLAAPSGVDMRAVLHEYFQLQTPLRPLYDQWSTECERLAQIAKCIPGVRIVQQDPFECLVSFLCSSNNNIPRITQMLSAIRRTYGTPLLKVGGITFYSFPSLETLLEEATDADLRSKCGMGYRAKYLMQTIQILKDLGGEKYLHELRSIDDPTEVQEKLIQFHGVGRKVADCIALFSLCQINAIPVDTHVWNIAIRDYDLDESLRAAKSLTPTIYHKVGGMFRDVFSEYAGWAHSLLFVAELPSFRPVLPDNLVEEMEKFREAEQAKKKAKKEKKDDGSVSSG